MLRAKSTSFLEAEWFTFGPESGRVQATDIDSDMRLEIMEIQVTVMDVNSRVRWRNIKYKKNIYYEIF